MCAAAETSANTDRTIVVIGRTFPSINNGGMKGLNNKAKETNHKPYGFMPLRAIRAIVALRGRLASHQKYAPICVADHF